MTTSIIGYPRIGAQRELKFATEKFFKKELSEADLQAVAATQRQANWQKQAAAGSVGNEPKDPGAQAEGKGTRGADGERGRAGDACRTAEAGLP